MSLAQVAYNISTDREFASQWRHDPKAALAGKDLKLSPEELDFLSASLKKDSDGDHQKVRLSDLALVHRGWM